MTQTVVINAQELNERQKAVLKEVCHSFISTGIPIGSRTISRSSGLSCSPATIRNEMADLEEMGYLCSPHISAGRIPTEKGYRFYVEFLLKFEKISRIEQNLLEVLTAVYEASSNRTNKILRTAIRVACEKTRLGGLIITPQQNRNSLQEIKLYRILEDKALLVTVSENGEISDELVRIPPTTPDEDLDEITVLLNVQLCHDRNVSNEVLRLRKSQKILERYNTMLSLLTDRIRSMIHNPDSESLLVEGFVNFFEQPEFNEPQKMRRMISLLDQKESLLELMANSLATDKDIMVKIGSDSGLEFDDLSFVTAKFQGPNSSVGQIGLIGPLRMDYARVVATLGEISRTLTGLFLGTTPKNNNG